MGVNHSMNRPQVDEVLLQFDATTGAIRGIDAKAQRMRVHIQQAQEQRDTLARYADVSNKLMGSLGRSLNLMSEDVLEYVVLTVDKLASLVENLEQTVHGLGILSAPRELKRELGPMLVPAVVLVLILTGSNCVFGFMLARDLDLARSLSPVRIFGPKPAAGEADEGKEPAINILIFFAIFHVVMIGGAALYLLAEMARRYVRKRRRLLLREQKKARAAASRATVPVALPVAVQSPHGIDGRKEPWRPRGEFSASVASTATHCPEVEAYSQGDIGRMLNAVPEATRPRRCITPCSPTRRLPPGVASVPVRDLSPNMSPQSETVRDPLWLSDGETPKMPISTVLRKFQRVSESAYAKKKGLGLSDSETSAPAWPAKEAGRRSRDAAGSPPRRGASLPPEAVQRVALV